MKGMFSFFNMPVCFLSSSVYKKVYVFRTRLKGLFFPPEAEPTFELGPLLRCCQWGGETQNLIVTRSKYSTLFWSPSFLGLNPLINQINKKRQPKFFFCWTFEFCIPFYLFI